MSKKIIIISLAVFQILLAACQASQSIVSSEPVTTSETISCITPISEDAKIICAQIENRILESTVRIEMEGFVTFGGYRKPITNGSKSHATILGHRYLLTHNHFKYSLTEMASAEGEGYTGITIRSASGELLLKNVPLTSLVIVYEEGETLIWDLVDEDGHSLIESLGLTSANIVEGDAVLWENKMELAQVDWDGEKAHIDWVLLDRVVTDQHVPLVEVDNFVNKGASGGGLFWNGQHIGNNWAKNLVKNQETGEVERLYTLVALNSAEIVNFGN